MSGFDARVLATTGAVARALGLNIEAMLEKPLRVVELERVLERLRDADKPLSAERLRAAIAGDELSLDFQPIVTRRPNRLKKLEALIRWNHPELGRISPAAFLPIAEGDPATISALTDWVLTAAVAAYRTLANSGVDVPLSVNISPLNLNDLALPDRIDESLRIGNMPAWALCLEITESAAFQAPDRAMDILSRIRLKGMHLSIDDFGTGYSSLKILRQMPFSEIKIDQSFIGDMTTSRDSRMIVKSIIELAANMDMASVAEGVETEETAALLETFGAGALQGYFFGQPMSVETVASWLAVWTGPDPEAAGSIAEIVRETMAPADDGESSATA
jgi:EAL domain-containing protein (putative c-di-GMP-specific phosphodiesterase class I)